MLGYKDRSAVLDAAHAHKVCPGGNGMFAPTVVIGGRVVGTWKRAIKKTGIEIVAAPFTALNKIEKKRFAEAAKRYGAFLNKPAHLLTA